MTANARILELLVAARAVQWSPGLLKSVESEGRITGEHPDPTSHIALDDRRLAVRAAVKRAERYLDGRKLDNAGEIVEQLEDSLERWATRL